MSRLSCPGLNRVKRSDWWTPHGSSTAEITYCQSCVSNMDIRGCIKINSHEIRTVKCNCDSFLLKSDCICVGNGLLKVYFWNKELTHLYKTIDNNVVEIPYGAEYAVFLYSVADQQYYTVNLNL